MGKRVNPAFQQGTKRGRTVGPSVQTGSKRASGTKAAGSDKKTLTVEGVYARRKANAKAAAAGGFTYVKVVT